jgi:hypothetical protein
MKYANGVSFSGHWFGGNKSNGVEIRRRLCDGEIEVYRGGYLCGRKHGPGSLKFADGSTFKGTWDMDVLCGKGVLKSKDGVITLVSQQDTIYGEIKYW